MGKLEVKVPENFSSKKDEAQVSKGKTDVTKNANVTSQVMPPKPAADPKVRYSYVGTDKVAEDRMKKYVIIFTPNKAFLSVFSGMILLSILLAIKNFPFSAFMSGNVGATISVGWPARFIELAMTGDSIELFTGSLILNLFMWSLFSYIANVVWNFLNNIKILLPPKVDKREKAIVYKDKPQKSGAEKLAEKLVSKLDGSSKTPKVVEKITEKIADKKAE